MPLTLSLSPNLEVQLTELAELIKGAGREVTAEEVAWIALADGIERLRGLLPGSEQSGDPASLRGDQDPGALEAPALQT
jgi:hypothetical protein